MDNFSTLSLWCGLSIVIISPVMGNPLILIQTSGPTLSFDFFQQESEEGSNGLHPTNQTLGLTSQNVKSLSNLKQAVQMIACPLPRNLLIVKENLYVIKIQNQRESFHAFFSEHNFLYPSSLAACLYCKLLCKQFITRLFSHENNIHSNYLSFNS